MPNTPETLVDAFVASTTGGGRASKVVALPNGNLLVTYSTDIGGTGHFIRGQQFDPAGNKIGEEMNFKFTREIEEPEFDIFVQPNGQVVIVAETSDNGDDLRNVADIEARTYNLNNGGDNNAVDVDNIASFPAFNQTFNPAIAGLDDGSYRVFFTANAIGQDTLRVTAVDGESISEDRVTPFAGRQDADVDAETLANGNIVTILDRDSDKGSRDKIDYRIISPDGSVLKTGEFGSSGRAQTFDPTVQALANGGFVVAWAELDRPFVQTSREDTDIYVQMFNANGNPTTGRIIVGDTNANDNNNEPAIAALEDGGFIVFYDKDRGGQGLRGQRFDNDGNKVGNDFLVFQGIVGEIDATTLPDGRVAVSFSHGGNVKVEILEVDIQGFVQRGDDGADTLIGGDGDDTIFGQGGNDLLEGGDGDDDIRGEFGNDTLDGGGGNDQIFGGRDNDQIDGGAGDDSIRGEHGSDSIDGSGGNDSIFGDDGNDTLDGGDGDDFLRGGNGADSIDGGDGNDVIGGQSGNDTIFGGNGNDSLFGDDGNDEIDSGGGNDTVFGGRGNDTLDGRGGNDLINGGNGNDEITGGLGGDSLFGNAGNDVINGNGGGDFIDDGDGDDTVFGGGGNDTIDADDGNDLFFGGAGSDTFIFDNNDDGNVIGDFDALDDNEVIDVRGISAITSFADLSNNHLVQVQDDVVINNNGAAMTITLKGVNIADLDANDFIF